MKSRKTKIEQIKKFKLITLSHKYFVYVKPDLITVIHLVIGLVAALLGLLVSFLLVVAVKIKNR